MSDGKRVNQWGGNDNSNAGARRKSGKRNKKWRPSHRTHTKRKADGSMETQGYEPPTIANPGNVIRLNVGGGQMGSRLAHENEGPFPEALAEWFVLSCCPPGGTVLDPFSGSGTTMAVCLQHGRNGVGVDIRKSQTELAKRRLRSVQPVLF